MARVKLKTYNRCGIFKTFSQLLFLFLLQGIFVSSLESTTYTTGILSHVEDPYINAIQSEDMAEIRSLIDAGNSINETTISGYTPLMAAVYKGNIEIIELLITAGADLERYDNMGNNALMYAFFGSVEKTEIAKLLIGLSADTKIMNSSERTPLILATLNGHLNSIKLLINSGANIEAKGSEGGSALIHAVNNNSITAAKLLIDLEANIETRDVWTMTPLMSAAFVNGGAMIRDLISAGADVNAVTTKRVPISQPKDRFDYFPKTVYIPVGSSALDIAKQFEKRYAVSILED